jgi:iron complex outermembrane receptor protein
VNISFLQEERLASLAACRASGFCTFADEQFLAFAEETVTNYEIGFKGSVLENRLHLTAAVYFMNWEDMIQPNGLDWDGDWNDGTWSDGRIFDVTGAGGFQNTGDGELKGIELEANWRATDNWRFQAAVAIASAEYSDACLSQPLGWGYEPTDLIEDTGLSSCYRVDGNDLYRQPDNTLTASSIYSHQIGGGGWDWSWRLGVKYSSKEYLDELNLAYLPAKTLVDTSVSFRNDNWNLTLFGSNLTDNDTPNNVQFNRNWSLPGNTFGFNVRPRQPTEYGVRVRYSF